MKRIAILGSGLLGGSLALAIQKYAADTHVRLYGRRDAAITDALAVGITDASTDLSYVVENADLIVLASPVGAMLNILQSVTDVSDIENVTITDVGSVKLTPRDLLEKIVKQHGARYIGSHPMAGSEQAGVTAADSELFQHAACVITNDFGYEETHVQALQSLWEQVGCRCHRTTSEQHDAVMARISHLPHMLASVGALVGLKNPDDGKFAGNGMRDTTRVAAGHPAMWAEILLRNRESLRAPIQESIDHLREMLALLDNSDEEKLTAVLQQGKNLRDQLS